MGVGFEENFRINHIRQSTGNIGRRLGRENYANLLTPSLSADRVEISESIFRTLGVIELVDFIDDDECRDRRQIGTLFLDDLMKEMPQEYRSKILGLFVFQVNHRHQPALENIVLSQAFCISIIEEDDCTRNILQNIGDCGREKLGLDEIPS